MMDARLEKMLDEEFPSKEIRDAKWDARGKEHEEEVRRNYLLAERITDTLRGKSVYEAEAAIGIVQRFLKVVKGEAAIR